MIFRQNVQEDPINTYRPFYEKFQNHQILGKSLYYRPWFFAVLDDVSNLQKSQILTELLYHRSRSFDKMFKRTQLILTDSFMRNFKITKFWEKALTIDNGFSAF